MHYLGLAYPFPGCPGPSVCADARQCFECHSLSVDWGGMVASARFVPVWRHWHAILRTKQGEARKRLSGSVSLPVIRDCVLCREWYPACGLDGDLEVQRGAAAFHMWLVGQFFKGRNASPRHGIDLLRIFECLCSWLGVAPGFHCSQLTPMEYTSMKQVLWYERYVQQQLARHSSGSRRKLDRFKYMQELEKDDEQVEAGVGW